MTLSNIKTSLYEALPHNRHQMIEAGFTLLTMAICLIGISAIFAQPHILPNGIGSYDQLTFLGYGGGSLLTIGGLAGAVIAGRYYCKDKDEERELQPKVTIWQDGLMVQFASEVTVDTMRFELNLKEVVISAKCAQEDTFYVYKGPLFQHMESWKTTTFKEAWSSHNTVLTILTTDQKIS